MQYRFTTPEPLKTRRAPDRCKTALLWANPGRRWASGMVNRFRCRPVGAVRGVSDGGLESPCGKARRQSHKRGFQAWACSFLKGRQGLDRLAGFLLDKAQLIELLQVEPELRTGAEEVAQAQGRIAGDGPPAVQNLAQVRE